MNVLKKKNVIKYDLEERTAKFGEDVINFCRKVPRNSITTPLVTQLVKATTSVAVPELKDESEPLLREAKELNLIFNSIFHKTK